MKKDSYADKQFAQNAAYRDQYDKWVASLSTKQKRKLKEQGLLKAEVNSFETGKPIDVSELPIAAPKEHSAQDEIETDSEEVWAALRRLIAELLADHNPALALDCLALVSGVGFLGESMTRIAKRHKVTRAAVSKRCIQLTEQLNMMPSRSMKSLTARQRYRTAQTKNYEYRESFDYGRSTRSSD